MEKNNSEKNQSWLKRIVLFLVSQTITLLGSSIVSYAIIWHVTLETSSGIMMMVSSLANFLPQIVISLFAGVWADRYHRKKLIVLADGLIAFSTLIIALLFLSGYQELWLLFLISAIRSVGAGIQTPAVSALLPQLVPEDKLMKVNGINGSIQSLTFIVAPAISGGILAALSLEAVFFIDIVTAVIGIGLLVFIPIPLHKKAMVKSDTSAFDDLKEGIRYIKNHRFIKTLFIFYGLIMFLMSPVAFLTPLLITREYGSDVFFLTLNEIFFSGGTMIGGILIALWGGFKNRVTTIAVGTVFFGIFIALLGINQPFTLYLLFIFLSGLAIPFLSSPSNVLIQEMVEPDMLGRVFSLMVLISTSVLPLGMTIFGPLADQIPIQTLLVFTGVVTIVCGIMIHFNKHLKNIPKET